LITWSDNEGETWSEPVEPFSPEKIGNKTGLFRNSLITSLCGDKLIAVLCWVDHSDPILPFFNEKTEGLLDTRIFLAFSEDKGLSWSNPVLVDTSPFNIPTPLTGPILKLKNGKLVCQYELNKHYYDPIEWRHSSVLMVSDDGGKTWPEHVIVSNDPENRMFYWDQRPAVMKDGDILDLFWTFDKKSNVYLDIHAKISSDNCLTWSEFWDTGVSGQPAQPVSMADGSIVMVYVDRTKEPIIKARQSYNKGRTWSKETEIILYRTEIATQTWKKKKMQDAWAEMSRYSIGLPATAKLNENEIIVVFYAGKHTDETDIKWVRIKV
jgi:hypothetical protein